MTITYIAFAHQGFEHQDQLFYVRQVEPGGGFFQNIADKIARA